MCKIFSKICGVGSSKTPMITKVIIKRGNGKNHDYVLEDGEVAYNRTDKEFYVGDGNAPIKDLKSFNGIVEGDNGIVYLVRVDENGKPEAKEMVAYNNSNKLRFYTKK